MTEVFLIAIVFFAASQQTITGFGFSLIVMPLITFLFGLQIAAPLVAMQGLTLYIVNLTRYHRHINIKEALRLGIAAALGVPIGVWALANLNAVIIKSVLGFVLIVYAGFSFTKPAGLHLHSKYWFLPFGFVAGCLAGAYNTPGPLLVLYGSLRGWQKEEFRAILQVLFFVTGTLTLISHWIANHVTPTVLTYYFFSAPVLLISILIGSRIDRIVHRDRFRVLMTIMILILGISLVIESFRQ